MASFQGREFKGSEMSGSEDEAENFLEQEEERKREQEEIDEAARLVPNNPRTLKIFMSATMTVRDIEPEDYLGAIAELLFLTIVGSYIITRFAKPELLRDNPIINMVGYNNPCAYWDQPPALYFAFFMFCPMVFLGIRYSTMDTVRAKLTRGVGDSRSRQMCCSIINKVYGISQIILMGIFIVRPQLAPMGEITPEMKGNMDWHMRVHSACFLQFVPVLCVTISANYIEGYMSGNPRSKPTAVAWLILAFYITATILETIFATYAIMFYQGNYQKPVEGENEPQYLVPKVFMMTVDYCWFASLPLAAAFQPQAPNLEYKIRLEPSWELYDKDVNQEEDEFIDWEDEPLDGGVTMLKVFVSMLIVWAHMIPFLCLILWAAHSGGTANFPPMEYVLAVGIGTPLLITLLLFIPIKWDNESDPNPMCSTPCCFSLNGAKFTLCNYQRKLAAFFMAAKGRDFRPPYGTWFKDQCDTDDSDAPVSYKFGGNSEMIYDWSACKERLESMGARAQSGEMKRESELALTVLNNLMWPEAGKFSLGYDLEDHAFVRPYLAEVFDCGQGNLPQGWTYQILLAEFRKHFRKLKCLDNNLVTRNAFDVTDPTKSKTIITQLVLKVLHRIAFGVHITDADAVELAALQTTQLLPAVAAPAIAKTLFMWGIIGGPARSQAAKWIKRYEMLCKRRWPNLENENPERLPLLGSCFLDTFLQAGGRSVPLAIDLVLGYSLSKNKPVCLQGRDLSNPEILRKMTFECMRYHPPVTVIPTWVRTGMEEEDGCEWKHQLICLDRGLADPAVFRDPDDFIVDREENERCSMAWGDFACVNGDKAHPNSHCCPGKELSINMVTAFVMAYNEHTWELKTDDIHTNYYGTNGFKCTKVKKT